MVLLGLPDYFCGLDRTRIVSVMFGFRRCSWRVSPYLRAFWLPGSRAAGEKFVLASRREVEESQNATLQRDRFCQSRELRGALYLGATGHSTSAWTGTREA